MRFSKETLDRLLRGWVGADEAEAERNAQKIELVSTPEVITARYEICAEAEAPTPESAGMPVHGQVQMKGGWAETVFQARTVALGFVPFCPVVACTALDVVLEWDGNLVRVQVKSAWELSGSGYCFQFPIVRNAWRRGKRKPYGASIDFFAAYLPTLNAWYIIPANKINWRHQSFGIYPREWSGQLDALGRRRRQRKAFDYEKYRERWDLLKKAVG